MVLKVSCLKSKCWQYWSPGGSNGEYFLTLLLASGAAGNLCRYITSISASSFTCWIVAGLPGFPEGREEEALSSSLLSLISMLVVRLGTELSNAEVISSQNPQLNYTCKDS